MLVFTPNIWSNFLGIRENYVGGLHIYTKLNLCFVHLKFPWSISVTFLQPRMWGFVPKGPIGVLGGVQILNLSVGWSSKAKHSSLSRLDSKLGPICRQKKNLANILKILLSTQF